MVTALKRHLAASQREQDSLGTTGGNGDAQRLKRARGGIDAAHARGLKVTGHLCSVTYPEAADLGIGNLEHGSFVNTQLNPDKKPDICPTTSRRRPAGRGPGLRCRHHLRSDEVGCIARLAGLDRPRRYRMGVDLTAVASSQGRFRPRGSSRRHLGTAPARGGHTGTGPGLAV